jgi:hypothetical protein
MHGAIAENRSVHKVHEDSSTELRCRTYCMPFLQEQKTVTPQSRKKCILVAGIAFTADKLDDCHGPLIAFDFDGLLEMQNS